MTLKQKDWFWIFSIVSYINLIIPQNQQIDLQKRDLQNSYQQAKFASKGEQNRESQREKDLQVIQVEFQDFLVTASGQRIILYVCLVTSVIYLIASCTKVVLCLCRRINVFPPQPPVRG